MSRRNIFSGEEAVEYCSPLKETQLPVDMFNTLGKVFKRLNEKTKNTHWCNHLCSRVFHLFAERHASRTLSHFVLDLQSIRAKVWTSPPLLLRFIPADCSFSNVNGARLGLGFLPCQLATGAVGRI